MRFPYSNMICILMVAAHAVRLESEISECEEYRQYVGVPKALLPAGGSSGKVILDLWWEEIKRQHSFQRVFLVCNANKFKYFQRWASANDFPLENIINDGTTSVDHALGAVADLELVLRSKQIEKEHVIVIAADMAFYDNFDFGVVLTYFHHVNGSVSVYYELGETDRCDQRGMLTIDETSKKVIRFDEKPKECESRKASVVFYCLQAKHLSLFREYARTVGHSVTRSLGDFMEWFVQRADTYALKIPTSFRLIGSSVGLQDYKEFINRQGSVPRRGPGCLTPLVHRAYARVGIAGNPSDGYFGKTLSMTISNFWCEVSIQPSDKLRLIPHPLNDPTEFGSLSDLHGISMKEGYLGGLRLLQATCKKFFEFCLNNGIALVKKNFALSYDTNIPRQVGLAGSSGIVTATMRCLFDFFGVSEEISRPRMPNLILSVEQEELFINAGLQDRVVQVYEGLVFMDFSKHLMEAQGHGDYQNITDAGGILNGLFLVWSPDPSDSGKIHSNVRERYKAGDREVIAAMETFARYAEMAKAAVESSDVQALCNTMDANFDLRRSIFGDACLGHKNLEMISIGRSHGAATKFPGSGGAILGLCRPGVSTVTVRHDYESKGYVFVQLQFHENKK